MTSYLPAESLKQEQVAPPALQQAKQPKKRQAAVKVEEGQAKKRGSTGGITKAKRGPLELNSLTEELQHFVTRNPILQKQVRKGKLNMTPGKLTTLWKTHSAPRNEELFSVVLIKKIINQAVHRAANDVIDLHHPADDGFSLFISKEYLTEMRSLSQHFIRTWFRKAVLLTAHAGRKSLAGEDLDLVLDLSDPLKFYTS